LIFNPDIHSKQYNINFMFAIDLSSPSTIKIVSSAYWM
jgi:hypothetical protein